MEDWEFDPFLSTISCSNVQMHISLQKNTEVYNNTIYHIFILTYTNLDHCQQKILHRPLFHWLRHVLEVALERVLGAPVVALEVRALTSCSMLCFWGAGSYDLMLQYASDRLCQALFKRIE